MRQFDGSYLHHNNINLETGLWAPLYWQWLIKTFPGIYYSVMTAITARTPLQPPTFSLKTSENNKEVSKTYLCQLKGPLKVRTRKIVYCNKGQ